MFMQWRQLARILPLGVYASLLTWFSLTPGMDSGAGFSHADKVMHLGAYFVFVLLCLPVMRPDSRIAGFVLPIILFGALLEMGQGHVPKREMSPWDFLANSLGALLGGLTVLKLRLSPGHARERDGSR